MITSLLFDNDGILVDTEKYYYRASKEVLSSVGLNLTIELFNHYSLNKGVGVWEAFEGQLSKERIVHLRSKRDLLYRSYLASEPIVVKNVESIVKELSQHYSMAIITTALKEDFETIHKRTNLLPYFDFYLTNGDYSRSKPHPDPYLAGCEKMGCVKSTTLVIEDTLRGVRSAKATGIKVVAIPNSFNKNDDFSEADYHLDSIEDLPQLLRHL